MVLAWPGAQSWLCFPSHVRSVPAPGSLSRQPRATGTCCQRSQKRRQGPSETRDSMQIIMGCKTHAMHLGLSGVLVKMFALPGGRRIRPAPVAGADLGKASLLQSRGAAGRKLLIASELCSIGSKAGLGPGLPPRPQSLISIY